MEHPNVADWMTAGGTVALALTGIGAIIYTHLQLKQNRESERVRHILDFVMQFEREPMAGYRKSCAEQRLKGGVYPAEAQNLLNFFETIGLLVRRGYLDVDDVWSSFSYWMFNIYADFRDDIEQEQRSESSYYRDSCELLRELQKIEDDDGGTGARPSKEEIKDFWREELKTIAGKPLQKRNPRKLNRKPKVNPSPLSPDVKA